MSQQTRSAPDIDLSMLLNQAGHALTNRLATALNGAGVSVKAYCVLKKAVEDDYTQAQLAELAWMDKTTMVNVLDEMEAAGLALRTLSPADRRVRLVTVTAKGREALDRADSLVQKTYDEVLTGLPKAQRSTFLAALTSLVEGPLAAPFHMEDNVGRARRGRR